MQGIIACVTNYDPHLIDDSWHCHDNTHISFVLEGGWSEKKKELYERLPGKVTICRAGEPHQIIKMHNSRLVDLEMEESFFRQYGIPETVFDHVVPSTPDINFLMLRIYKELMAGDSFTDTSIGMLLLQFFHQPEFGKKEEKMPAWLKTIGTLLKERWNETPTLTDLSVATDIHPVTISHYFPKYYRCTLGAYMRKLKVERALCLIKSSAASLTNIAYECGFFDQSHFTRTFKELTGFCPSQYQRI